MLDDHPNAVGLWNNGMASALESRFGRPLKPSEFSAGKSRARLNAIDVTRGQRSRFELLRGQPALHLVKESEGLSREEMLIALRKYLFKAVATHEIGHIAYLDIISPVPPTH